MYNVHSFLCRIASLVAVDDFRYSHDCISFVEMLLILLVVRVFALEGSHFLVPTKPHEKQSNGKDAFYITNSHSLFGKRIKIFSSIFCIILENTSKFQRIFSTNSRFNISN